MQKQNDTFAQRCRFYPGAGLCNPAVASPDLLIVYASRVLVVYTIYMQDDKFDKLFNYMVDMDRRMTSEFAEVRSDIRSLLDAPDHVLARLDDEEADQAVRDAQFQRLVEWARKVSKKTGIPLPDL